MVRYSFLFILIFASLSCFPQSEKDSLLNLIKSDKKDTTHINVLLQLSKLPENDFAASRRLGMQAIDLSKSLKSDQGLLQSYINMLKLYRSERVNDTALQYANKSKMLALQLADVQSLAEIKLDEGNVHLNAHNYLNALSAFVEAARVLDSLQTNPKSQMIAYANIGNVEEILGNYEKALDYINKGRLIAAEINYEEGVAYCYKTMGRIYRKLTKLELAESAYKQALRSYQKMANARMTSEVFQNLGTVYFDEGSFSKAINHYEQSLIIAKENRLSSQIPYVHSALGASWYALKNYPKAKVYFDSTLTLAHGSNPYLVKDSYESLSQIAEREGKFQQSLIYFKLFANLKDSLVAIENKSAAEEIEAKYQNESKQNEINLLTKDRELQEAKLKRQQGNILIGAIAMISILIIGIVLINRYRVINRIRRQMELERMRQTISRDLHDDIGSALSSINILSKVAQEEKGNTQNYLQRIGDQSARMMENMSDMVWSINPGNDSIEQVIVRMREFATELLEVQNIQFEFQESVPSGTMVNSEKRRNLFLIFKETVNNAAKYSNASLLKVSLTVTGNRLCLVIADDGKGFDEVNVKAGNGLRNLRVRAAEISGILHIKSETGKGTHTELQFALT